VADDVSDAERQMRTAAELIAAQYAATGSDERSLAESVMVFGRGVYAAAMRAAAARVRARCEKLRQGIHRLNPVCAVCEEHAVDLETIAERVKRGERAVPA